jgi:nitrate reductase gamma subunit
MMSNLLHFAEHTLQEVALIFMALVYVTRLVWLLRFKAGKERQAATGIGDTNPRKGFIYSWANIGMPWAMESSRTQFFNYVQFAVFHLGVVSAILLSFVIPYGYGINLLPTVLATIFQISIGAAFLVGVIRIIRRMSNIYLRAISSPDDHFSLWLLTVWFGFAFFAVPNNLSGGEFVLLVYFILTAFFLMYVPFSKISHYLYYPFTRYYLGKTLGHRGVYPIKHHAAK